MFKKIVMIGCVLLAVGCTAFNSTSKQDLKPMHSEYGDKICTAHPYFVNNNKKEFSDSRSIQLSEYGDHFSVIIGELYTESPVLGYYPTYQVYASVKHANDERVYYSRTRTNGSLVYTVEVQSPHGVGLIIKNCK